jgi:hypothetical protein
MGLEKCPQFWSRNGCVYVFNQVEKRWYKICPADELPIDIKTQVKELQDKAESLAGSLDG